MATRSVRGRDGEPVEVASTDPVESVDLAALREALARGERPPTGALLGLPPLEGDVRVDTAHAAAVAGVAPKTITSWLSRGQPRRCSFPAPHRILYRLYWPLSAVEAWRGTRPASGPQTAGPRLTPPPDLKQFAKALIDHVPLT
ncbi:hypothetical protein HII36_11420 [Nonomuraea sp. NN258]|uniref:hypothetical protein n=1 Tax=Nonomuraea antri TaxID=2730852 RepID=UPI001569E7B8|nr:hypothetical protein [Nonomuraea antri]NRQ32444.1 hypothetical protein [Nonomuraea antri]